MADPGPIYTMPSYRFIAFHTMASYAKELPKHVLSGDMACRQKWKRYEVKDGRAPTSS